MRTFRTLLLLTAIAVPAVVATGAGPAAGVPEQASPAGEANAHTHGPDPLDLDRRGRTPGALQPAPAYDVDAWANWNASEWDGSAPTTDQQDLAAHAGLGQFHAVYMYPAKSSSRFAQFAAMFQADAKQASDRLSSLYGRALRWDYKSNGKLDITVVQSSYNAQRLSGGGQFNLVRNELISKGFNNPNKKYVVWLDAGSSACGQGELYQDTRRSAANNSELRTTAIVYRPYTSDALTGGFCRGRTLMHEMGHNMGALQKVAPHAFDQAHCNDSAEDVMCYTSAVKTDTGPAAFDYGNDDYWDPNGGKLAWWTVNLSKYVCPSSSCTSAATPNY